jgi:ABC-type molybdate transport system permease subunit
VSVVVLSLVGRQVILNLRSKVKRTFFFDWQSVCIESKSVSKPLSVVYN